MGRFSPDHDQRKGQWICNYLTQKLSGSCYSPRELAEFIENKLWNMTNEEFEAMMKEGNFYER